MATEGSTRLTSLPARTPAIVRRHPALLVEWLRIANSLARWQEEGSRTAFFVFGLIVGVAVLLLAFLFGQAVPAVKMLAQYWLLVGVVSAVYAFTSVNRRRRHLEESQGQSWLIATPISPSSLRISHAIRTLLPLFVIFAAAVMFAVCVLLLHGPVFAAAEIANGAGVNDGVAAATGIAIAAIGGGLLVGGSAGWWMAGRGRAQAGAGPGTGTAASRYVPRLRVAGALRPSAEALSHWPIAQVFAWSRPENSRYVVVVALLSVQGGSSAIAGLSVVAMYFAASYLAALLSAMMTVSNLAATWLRATPMTLGAFVLALSRRAFVHQLIGSALAVGLMSLLGAPLGMALELAGLWLALVVSIWGFALVDSYRGRSPAVKIALSVAAFAALAAVLHMRAGAKA